MHHIKRQLWIIAVLLLLFPNSSLGDETNKNGPHATGLIPHTEKEKEHIRKNWPKVKKVWPNVIGKKRINEHRKKKGLPELDESEIADMGQDTLTTVNETDSAGADDNVPWVFQQPLIMFPGYLCMIDSTD